MASFRKTAWCVRCNAERPYRRAVFGKRRAWACMTCGEQVHLKSKYRNIPTASKFTVLPSGKPRVFQSAHEARREPVLLAMQAANIISDLQYQVPFRIELYATGAVEELLRAIDHDPDAVPHGVRILADVVRRSRQYVTTYKADYTYRMGGNLVVEDPKGAHPEVYRIKKALMALGHNIEIIEPDSRGVEQRARGAGVVGPGTGSRFKGGR